MRPGNLILKAQHKGDKVLAKDALKMAPLSKYEKHGTRR